MTTTYTDAQFSELIDEMLSYARMVGYAKSAGERENHKRSCDTAKDIVMSAYTDALAERKAAIQPKGGVVANLVIGGYGDNDANFNHCHEQASRALRYLAEKPCPNGGEQFPNSECCYMIAEELDRSFAAIKRHAESQPPQHVQPQESRMPELVQLFLQSEAEYGSEMAERGILFSPELSCEHALRIVISAIQPQHVHWDGGDVRGDEDPPISLADMDDLINVWTGTIAANGSLQSTAAHELKTLVRRLQVNKPVRSVSEEDVRQCLSVWRKSPACMDAEQTMRAALEAFLKGGEK